MMKLKKALPAAALLAALLAAPAQAAPIGTLVGWASLGDVQISGTTASLTTASLLYEDDFPSAAGAYNLSGVAAADVGVPGGIETFVGLPIGMLDPDPLNGVVALEGSAIKHVIDVQAGDTLSFDWVFSSMESLPTDHNDYAFVVIDDVLTLLGDVASASAGGRFSQHFAVAGKAQIALGVVDVLDYDVTSRLEIGAFDLSPAQTVPEPETLALGLGALALSVLRRRSTKH
jgi:hypothetical protein